VKNHDFTPKNYIFSNFMGGGAHPFQIWQSSIVQINLSITFLRLIPTFRPVFDDQC
jgi:hypothetical protein